MLLGLHVGNSNRTRSSPFIAGYPGTMSHNQICYVFITDHLVYVCYSWLIIFLPSVDLGPLSKVRSMDPNHIEEVVRDVHKRFSQMGPQQGMENQGFLLIVILLKLFGSHSMHTSCWFIQHFAILWDVCYIYVCLSLQKKIKRSILQFLINASSETIY